MGIEAVNAGFKVYFVNAGTLVEGLKNANMKGTLEKKTQKSSSNDN